VEMLLWLQPISTLPTERRRLVWKAPLCSGWVPNDLDGNEIQSAYQIKVTRVSDSLVIWDSGKVPSSVQSFVAYAGPALAAGTSYTWTVRTWDRDRSRVAMGGERQL